MQNSASWTKYSTRKANSLSLLFLALATFVAWFPPGASATMTATFLDSTRNNNTFTEIFQVPRITHYGGFNWTFAPFNGRLVLPSATAQEKLNAAVLLLPQNGYSHEALVLAQRNAGAVAFVVSSRAPGVAGRHGFSVDGSNVRDFYFPVVEISQQQANQLSANLSSGINISVTITCCDLNEWAEWKSSGWMIAFSVVLGSFTTFVFIYSFAKLLLFIRSKSPRNIGFLLLVLITIGTLIRTIYVVVDPIISRKTITNPAASIMLTVHLPFSVVSTLAVTMCWLEVINQNGKTSVGTFLQRLFIPFICIGVFLFVLEFITSSLRGLNFNNQLTFALGIVCYIIVELLITVLFAWTGFSILRQLNDSAQKTASLQSSVSIRLRRATRWILLSIVGNVLFIAPMPMGVTALAHMPVSEAILYFVAFLGVTWADFCLVHAVRISRSSTVSGSVSGPRSTSTRNASASSS